MDIVFLQVVMLFIPGIVWERIDTLGGVNRPTTQFDVIRRTICFGIAAYVVTALIFMIVSVRLPTYAEYFKFEMVSEMPKDKYVLGRNQINEMLFASMLGILLSGPWLYITNNKLPIRMLQFLRATKRYGDEDVWDFTFNSRDASVEYVHVRDYENEKTFAGWVDAFSETGKVRELILRDVIVYDAEGLEIYQVPRMYIARAMDKVDVEFPYQASNNNGATDGRRS